MEPTYEELQATFRKFSDEKLIKLATEEAKGLREEALIALKEEMSRRNFSADVLKGMELNIATPSDEVVSALCEFVRTQPCPICVSNENKLNASIKAKAISFIFLTSYTKDIVIACPTCLDNALSRANLYTALLGWWAFPWGLIRPFQAFYSNYSYRKQHHQLEPSELLNLYVGENLGKIQANENNPEQLAAIIRYPRFQTK